MPATLREARRHDLTSPAFHADPFPALGALREEGPLVASRLPLIGAGWLATTHEACAAILKNQEDFVRDAGNAGRTMQAGMSWWMPRSIGVLADNMLGRDDPEHRRLRGLVDQAFQRRGVAELRPRIEQIADGLLDRLEAKGGGDIVHEYARDLPLAVICELLGVESRDLPRFKRWAGRLTAVRGPLSLIAAMHGIGRLIGHLTRQFDEVRLRPRAGLMTALVEAESGGGRLSEDELLSMVFLLFVAGHETTTHLIAGSVLALLRHPEERDRLVGQPALIASAVEECLRWVCPVQMAKPRYAARDLEFASHAIRRGEIVVPFLAAANADPAKFEGPEHFDIGRQPNPHLSFGTGVHFCLGFQLARLEAQVALERLFGRFPDLQLAISADRLNWRRRLGLRALESLPVKSAA